LLRLVLLAAAWKSAAALHATLGDLRRVSSPQCNDARHGRQQERDRLSAIYRACSEGRSIGEGESKAMRAIGGWRSDRYGEITPRGLSELGKSLELAESDRFVDLGSGLGRACSQVVGEFDVRAATGIEFSSTRHALALEELGKLDPRTSDRVRLVCADCADRGLWAATESGGGDGVLSDASVVYTCSALFGDALMRRLGRRLSSSEHVRTVASLRRFPAGALAGYRRRPRPVRLEMSWTVGISNPEALGSEDDYGGALVHIYDRLNADEQVNGNGARGGHGGGWLQCIGRWRPRRMQA